MVKEIDASFQTIQVAGREKHVAYHRRRLVAGKWGTGAFSLDSSEKAAEGRSKRCPFI